MCQLFNMAICMGYSTSWNFTSLYQWPVSCEREFSFFQREVSVPLQPSSAVFLLSKRDFFAKESRLHDMGQYINIKCVSKSPQSFCQPVTVSAEHSTILLIRAKRSELKSFYLKMSS
jgi:hypothetical protein